MKCFELWLLGWIKERLWIKLIKFDGLRIYWLDYRTLCSLFIEVFLKNEYKFHTQTPMPKILDLGANIWMATMYFKRLYPNAKIISFEPDNKHFKILQKNVMMNEFDNVVYNEKAVTNYTWTITFYTDDKPSLLMSTKRWRISKIETKVECISISDIIHHQEFDLLKMDIEWWEFAVLKQLDTSGDIKYIKEMIIEYHHNIQDDAMSFSEFLSILEKNWFTYWLNTNLLPTYAKNRFQDILIHAYRI